ncbi:MAG: glycosyltransferase [Aquificae bacterium]|nr:glycosyltransferase [Aquificota bacterium]
MSKISVLIPTYNRPDYLKQALESVLKQTRLPDEVIIADDNPKDSQNYETIKDYIKKYDFIRYIKHKKNIGPVANFRALFNHASGDYIKWLAEDDYLLPQALERLSYFLDTYPEVKVATSARIAVDKYLNPLSTDDIPATRKLFNEDTVIDGKVVGKVTLLNLSNYIGEFSTFLFRKRDVDFELFKLGKFSFRANADWFTWLMLAKKGKVAYISEPLSLFRIDGTNDQCNPDVMMRGFEETFFFVENDFFNREFNITKEEKKYQLTSFIYGLLNLSKYPDLDTQKDIRQRFKNFVTKAVEYNKRLYKKQDREPVSVITVTYNSERTLENFLNSVLPSLSEEDELVIVDNSSTDGTVKLLKGLNHKNLKIILNPQNLGYPKAINIGIKASKNPNIIFLNPDTIVPDGWIDSLLQHFTSEDIGGVAPLSSYAVPFQQYISYFPELVDFDEKNVDLLANYIKNKNYKKSVFSKLLIGFCFATKREILQEVGYFDEDLFLGNDDLEICWRLRENGYKLKVALDSYIYHKGQESFKTQNSLKIDKLVQESTDKLADKLIEYYGYGNVPHPTELWGIDWFIPKGERYKFMFSIRGKNADLSKLDTRINQKVVVILVSYQNIEDTFFSIKSLLEQDYPNLSIVVIDNSHSEEYPKSLYKQIQDLGVDTKYLYQEQIQNAVISFDRDVIVVKSKENLGFGGGNNLGIQIAQNNKADYIWVLNPDTVVQKDTLEEMLKTSAVYDAPLVTCKIKDFKDRTKVQYDGKVVSLGGKTDSLDIIKIPLILSGANILFKTDLIEDVGYWDEDFFLYFEDNHFTQNVKRRNILHLYTPYTHIYHKGGGSIGGFLKSVVSVYYFSRNIFLLEEKTKDFEYSSSLKELLDIYPIIKHSKHLLRAMYLGMYDFLLGKKGKRENIEQTVKARIYTQELYGNQELDRTFLELFQKPRDKKLTKEFFKMFSKLLEKKTVKQPQ